MSVNFRRPTAYRRLTPMASRTTRKVFKRLILTPPTPTTSKDGDNAGRLCKSKENGSVIMCFQEALGFQGSRVEFSLRDCQIGKTALIIFSAVASTCPSAL